MNKPLFIMLVGLPGSGKSTYSKILVEEFNADVHSSDAIRIEIFGDENCQDNNSEVFDLMLDRTINSLNAGRNVVYDATNLMSQYRKLLLEQISSEVDCVKRCDIMATPFSECCIRSELREKDVPFGVIDSMYQHWDTPYWFEGWDEIYLHFPEDIEFNSIDDWLREYALFDQHRKNQSKTLTEHCAATAEQFKNQTMYYAGLLHDCGKPYVQSFVNRDGKIGDKAYYYNHQHCGAYDSLFFNYPCNIDRLEVSTYICWHMLPYLGRKAINYPDLEKMHKNTLGNKLYSKIKVLHMADKKAH